MTRRSVTTNDHSGKALVTCTHYTKQLAFISINLHLMLILLDVAKDLWLYTLMFAWACTMKLMMDLSGYKASYELIHSIVNGLISYNAIESVGKVLSHPYCIAPATNSWSLVGHVAVIHIFHLVAYWPLSKMDATHHVVMLGGCLPFLVFVDTGTLGNYAIFFICGCPGMISYICVFLARNRFITTRLSKLVNAYVNVCARMTFSVIGGGICVYNVAVSECLPIPSLIPALLVSVNSIVYAWLALESLYSKDEVNQSFLTKIYIYSLRW